MAKPKENEKETPETASGSLKRLLLIGLPVFVFLLAATGAGLYWMGVFESGDPSDSAASEEVKPKKEIGPLVEMEDLVVNIMHRDTTRFLKVGITLEVRDKDSSEAVKKRMPQITDAVLMLLGSKKYDDIKDLQGKMQLKADLLDRIRSLAGEKEIANLYFTDFVVQ
ncbi:MAG: flagellar basal body-associated FliL family protein [Deltaproteobacteria bacterium]|nr:flagellar basal body-associated FliL family protein [Deltaproteobacteria bacterium]MBW2078704.1 flagellar basal body-associated FliL family protein [Deltaproteobacteria bacterium]